MIKLDYAAIRQQVSICQVLGLIGFKPEMQRQCQWRGQCPICDIERDKHVQTQPSFSVHIGRNLFHCFRCHRSGNALDLWVLYSQKPLHRATLELCEKLGVTPIPQNLQLKKNT
jgi:DNA primase